MTEKTNPVLRDTWQKWVKNEVILTLGWHIVSVCFCHTHVFIVNLLLFLRSSQGVQLLKHKNQYSDTMNTTIADASQSDASSCIQFYSIIWKLGFALQSLDCWQTMTFQNEIHSLKMVILKSLAIVQSAATFKYRNLSNKDRRLSLLLHRASCRFSNHHTTNKSTNCMSFILNHFF